MMKYLLIIYLISIGFIEPIKHNFNINLSLTSENGTIHISSVKMSHSNGVDSSSSNNSRIGTNDGNNLNREDRRRDDLVKQTVDQSEVDENRITRSNDNSNTNASNNSNNDQSNQNSKNKKGFVRGVRDRYRRMVDNNREQYSNTNVNRNDNRSRTHVFKSTNGEVCPMNYINCSLSGARNDKLKDCVTCANKIYLNNQCEKYEPLSLLQLFSNKKYNETLVDLNTVSTLETEEEITDLKKEGLIPLDIEPKVSVHDLLYSYDHQNHVKPRDLYCNDYECLRLRDKSSCVSQLPTQNQSECGSCWIFANTLHLEILLCMESTIRRVRRLSEMYIASCMNMSGRNPCRGGNTLLYSQIISNFEFIPSKDDLTYNLPVNNSCPRWDSRWSNQKPNIEFLSPQNNKLNSFRGFILIKRSEYDNTDEFINLVKDMVKEKGSVVISMIGQSVLKPDHDGTKVLKHCQHGHGTHAMVIIGYGIYVDRNGQRRRYWLIRNSWGPHWGDSGNFKLDIDGPPGCDGNVFEYAVVLNVKINRNNNHVNNGYVPPKVNIGSGVTRRINVKLGDKHYSRIMHLDNESDLNNEIECNRAFSINKNRNDECVAKCKRNLNYCKRYPLKDLGTCLFSIDHDYDCMMCGV